MSQPSNPYDTPESNVDVPNEGLRNDASRWLRFFAALIDGILAALIIMPLMLSFGVFELIASGQDVETSSNLMFGVIGIAIFMLLHGYLLKTKGQTIGKMILGIKIVDLQGNLPQFGKLISMRYLPLWVVQMIPAINILALVDVLFIFRGDRRCVHDLIAGTKVVRIIK